MPTITRNAVVEPKTLSEKEFESLADSLYAVHCQIFDGVSRDEFIRYVIRSSADQTKIQLSYGQNGELAGYIATHAFRRMLAGEMCTIIRAEAGLLRAYRGNGSPGAFFVSQLLKTQWDYRGPHYYLGCLVHPSSYTAFAREDSTVWPAPGVEIPDELLEFMMKLGDEFHLEMVDPSRPLVRRVGWITRENEVERRYWQTSNQQAARYYIHQNPGYVEGHGLLTLVPLDPAHLGKLVMNWSKAQIKKGLSRTMGSLERNVTKPKLDADDAENLLATMERDLGLDLDSIRNLGIVGTRYPVSARTVLFREGEKPDAAYVVIKGSVLVLHEEPGGEEVVIDQLGPYTLVGEMALVTGQPRTATVRVAQDSVLLRITSEDLGKLLSTAPQLEERLWTQITRRVFDLQIRHIPAHAGISLEVEEAWCALTVAKSLARNDKFMLDTPRLLVLAHGALMVESSAGFMTLSAPALVQLPADAKMTAIEPARMGILPATAPE